MYSVIQTRETMPREGGRGRVAILKEKQGKRERGKRGIIQQLNTSFRFLLQSDHISQEMFNTELLRFR